MPIENILSNVLVSLIISPIVIIATYYLNNKWDYYQHLFNLIDEIEFNMKELNEFPANFDKFIKADNSENLWLPKAVTIRTANLIKTEIVLEKIVKHPQNSKISNIIPSDYLVKKSGYIYSYFLDNAYVMFVNKGYPLILQSERNFLAQIIHFLKSFSFTSYGKNSIKGGIFERISKFYYFCNGFNFESQKIEEKIKQAKSKNNIEMVQNYSNELGIKSENYFKIIRKEYCSIQIDKLKISRIAFFIKIFVVFILILAIFVIYVMNISSQGNPIDNPLYQIIQYNFFIN